MPNCFTLTRKGETEPTALITLDEELCRQLGTEPHPKYYVESWYDLFGFALACGIPLDDARMDEMADGANKRTILAYLRAHFTADCWAEIGRR